jgi:ATP-dependent metalloprotease FtsH
MWTRLRTLALWVALIVLFVAIYEVLQQNEDAGPMSLETILAIGLVLVVLVALAVVVIRRSNQAGGNLTTLRKTTARLLAERPATRFTDVGGVRPAKDVLADIVDFLRQPERWHQSGARLPRGVLLEGPPGCGKTLLARALAGEASAHFFEVSATEFVELFVGVGAARVRDLFDAAAKKAPAIVFIDELDAVGRRRGAGAVALAHQEREHTLNQLLVSMDGFGKQSRVVVVAATNRADVLDPALLRPGRFDVRVAIGELSADERLEVLQIHTRTKPLAPGLDLRHVAHLASGLAGAELEHLANTAALTATRRARRQNRTAQIELVDFEEALAERGRRENRFDKLDALLIESTSQLAQPTGKVLAKVTLVDGAVVEGEVVWADFAFVKVLRGDGSATLVSKRQVRKLEAMAGTEANGDVVPDRWAGRQPDAS